MLDETSYITAVYVYVGAAIVMLLYLAWWLSRHWRPLWVSLVVLVLAALLLTPAYPKAGVTTMAPALIVALFQIATEGGIGVVIALFLNMTIFRRRNARKAGREKAAAKA